MKMISKFNGIELYPDYDQPVIHACYNGGIATFDLLTCQILQGTIERYMIILVVLWLVKYQGDVWEMFKEKKFKYIPSKDF